MEFKSAFIERVERTPMSNSYRFSRPGDFDFAAGQYIIVTLGEGEGLWHPLSLSDCPGEKGHIEFTKRMTGSPFCERLESLRAGDEVGFKGPEGKFRMDGVEGPVVFLTGGIGITPIRSILKHMSWNKDGRETTLLYGNSSEDDIAFLDELSSLELPRFRMVHVLIEPKGRVEAHKGFITSDIIAGEVEDPVSKTYFISGPPVMVDAMNRNLNALGVPEGQRVMDKFMGYD
jgi:ferredoxin-NADP reductase